MTLQSLQEMLTNRILTDGENTIQEAYALRPELVGIPYYEAPLVGCAAADDEIFELFQKDSKVYGAPFRKPEEWLDGAKSVVSFFLPYTEAIRKSNTPNLNVPSDEWLHARVEGQNFMMKMCKAVAEYLEAEGYQAVIPSAHPDFCTDRNPEREKKGEPIYKSSWSERHIAYAAGLGTFGLSKHIITEKGVCGRFGSVITNAVLKTTPRAYTEPYEYCTFCGACEKRCPVNAISLEKGKDVVSCSAFLDQITIDYAPRYGCGKCQLAVPCECKRPK